jgi:hypothetical protein
MAHQQRISWQHVVHGIDARHLQRFFERERRQDRRHRTREQGLARSWETHHQHVVDSCLWMMEQGKVHTPPAWYTASLKHNWNAPHGMPSDWLPTVHHFRVDENTFAQIGREMREEKRPATRDK